jgi:predicted dehydrogenase/nucleoside-diphosphate-sugar epimerase
LRIAVTGVTGFIGRHLASRALEHGFEVTAFSRRAWAGRPYVPLDDRHFLDLPGRPKPGSLNGVDALVHLAIAPQSARPAVVDAVNRVGTERLFDAAMHAGVARFVFVSSQSAHPDATSAYGRSKYAVERHLAGDPRAVVVRPGLVYGDADDGLMGRATRVAAKLRVFPVIGGRAALAQPIHVDQLCDGLLTLATMADPPALIELADPHVRQLGKLVQARAKERFGARTIAVPVPVGLARAGVRIATRLRLPSPISEENLDGIKSFRPMETAGDLERAGLPTSARVGARAPVAVVPTVEPRRLILVGAGRIGLVHALTAAHHQHMILVGIVDLDKGAIGRLKSMAGPTLRAFTDLDQAIADLRPEVAIIGTPPSSHVALARKLLDAGIDVLVEKPVAATDDNREELGQAVVAHPDRYLGTGYLAGLLPHLAAIKDDFRGGKFGTPVSFDAHAFVSRVEAGAAEKRGMWELDTSISGGGALVNLGVHVLAMIDVLLGPVVVDRAVLVASGGRTAEDGASLQLVAGGVPGHFSTAWHLPGFDMPENHLRIDTDRGYLVCTTSCAAFVGIDEVKVIHQVDADPGFDLAPMDAGGAFWAEQDLLARHVDGANSLALAARVEELITGVYRTADHVERPVGESHSPAFQAAGAASSTARPDLRGAPTVIQDAWTGPALTGTPTGGHRQAEQLSGEAIIALPDAPGHFRSLTNGGPLAVVRELGVAQLARAALGVSPLGAAAAAGRPWEALLVLLRAELRRIPRAFRGTLVVDAYLVDLATATGNIQPIEAALDDIRRYCCNAKIGVEVNAAARLAPYVPAIASQLDVVVALGTTRTASLQELREALSDSAELIVKTGVLPRELLEMAWDEPERWTGGQGQLVVHWPGAPALRQAHEGALQRAKLAAGLNPK